MTTANVIIRRTTGDLVRRGVEGTFVIHADMLQ